MVFKTREFYLVKPFEFEEREGEIKEVPKGMLLLKPLLCGICKSEILYFKGQKSEKKLGERLPMALLHEGVCVVEETGPGTKAGKGEIVVPIPFFVCGKCNVCSAGLPANLCQKGKYMGSTADGMARTFFLWPEEKVVPVSKETMLEAAALVEPASIALNAVEEAGLKPGQKVVVIGDGAMGYLIALMAMHVAKIPKESLFFVGISDERLLLAKDFSQTINSLKEGEKLGELRESVDAVFEAVGGSAQEKTVGQAIELLRPCGKAIVLGLAKGSVPIKLVDLVNKGLELKGVTRSCEEHYEKVAGFLGEKGFQERLARIASKKRFKILEAGDLKKAFEFAGSEEADGRVMVKFE